MKNFLKSCYEPCNYPIHIILISVVVFLFTFPRTEPDYGPGLDSSYVWAFNYLFANDYSRLTDLIYPFGPLGYLKMPVPIGSNLETGTLVFSLIKLLFILSLMYLLQSGKKSGTAIVASALITLIISYFCDIDLLITGLCVTYGILFLRKKNPLFYSAAVLFAALGLFIKSSIGVISFTIITGILVLSYINDRNTRKTMKLLIINIILFTLAGIAIFRGFADFLDYLMNIARLTSGYSSALAVYPENSWIALGIFITTVFLFPLLIKEKEPRAIWFLMLIPLFIIWKHSMSREDLTHNRIMLYFLFFFWGILAGITKERRLLLFLLPAVSIMAFYRNMSNLGNYQGYRIEIAGINNFYNSVIDIGNFKRKYSDLSSGNLQKSRLDPELLTVIGNSTIDFYPWELSFVPANGLNWLPRKTLQSGSFSKWLDRECSLSFEPENGPQFLMLHYVNDGYGGNFGSIDGRYMLNDEPKTIINIFKNYCIEKSYPGFVLFRKSDSSGLSGPVSEGSSDSGWGRWIEVPDLTGKILRVKLQSKANIGGKIKAMLYKAEALYIDYQFDDGKILTYRFNRYNAMDGLWISPFYKTSLSEVVPDKVRKIRFRCVNPGLFNNRINLEFESYSFARQE